MARADDLKKRMGKFWQSTVAQIEEVRDNVKARAGTARQQLEKEVKRLKGERDKLLVRLGEQTLEWVNKSPVRLPGVVQTTVDRLNHVIDEMQPKKAAPAAPAKKKAAKKAAKKTVKKLSAKSAKLEAKAPAKAPNKAPVARKPLAD
jgi:hypothetical protein